MFRAEFMLHFLPGWFHSHQDWLDNKFITMSFWYLLVPSSLPISFLFCSRGFSIFAYYTSDPQSFPVSNKNKITFASCSRFVIKLLTNSAMTLCDYSFCSIAPVQTSLLISLLLTLYKILLLSVPLFKSVVTQFRSCGGAVM